jgi:hypothetical protein
MFLIFRTQRARRRGPASVLGGAVLAAALFLMVGLAAELVKFSV